VSHDEELRSRLSFELGQIQREIDLIVRLLGEPGRLGPDEIKVRAAAGSLHAIYNGIEKMITFAVERKGIAVPRGEASHSELLQLARSSGTITGALEDQLKPYLGFRHFYRHSYGFMIDNELLNPLLQRVESVVSQLAGELLVEP